MPVNEFDISRQNSEYALRYRAGADCYFAKVEWFRRVELAIVAVSVGLGIYSASTPALQFNAAFWGFILAAADATVIYRVINGNRHIAAQMSDCFDRYLFSECPDSGLPCTPSVDLLRVHAQKHLEKKGVRHRLVDWYNPRIGELPKDIAHLAALRINGFWDSQLRGTYITVMLASAATVCVVALYLFAENGMTVARFVTNVLAPFSTAILWFVRELIDQTDARTRKLEFQRRIESFWDQVPMTSSNMQAEVEYLQSLLLAYRRTDVSVPAWLYKVTRARLHAEIALLMDQILSERQVSTGIGKV